MRQPSQEKKTVGNWYDFQTGQFNDFVQNQPLLQAGQEGALSFWDQLPRMLSQFPGFGQELQGYQGQIGGLYNQLGGMIPGVRRDVAGQQGQLSDIYNTLGGLNSSPYGPAAITATGGALTPQMGRDVAQQTRNIASAQGNARSTGALGTELLNRDAYRQQRYNTALQQEQGLLGQQAGVTGQESQLTGLGTSLVSGLIGQQGGLAGMGAGLVGQRAGLLGQEQALQTGGLNQLLGVQNAATQNFSGLTNPILGYLGNLFSGNQQASIAQAQIGAQQQAAGQSKGAGLASGGASIIGAVLPALMAFSDKRLKQNIRATGLKTSDGVPMKTFEYKARPGERILGVMAQDVEKKRPDAVMTDFWSGLKLIDRTKIDVPMGRVG